MTHQPPTWLILMVCVGLALPTSAVFGLLANWAFKEFYRRRDPYNPGVVPGAIRLP